MGWLHRIVDRIVAGEGELEDIDQLIAISEANDGTTICGMGDAAGYATVGILAKYRDEFEHWIAHERSRHAAAGSDRSPNGCRRRRSMVEIFIDGDRVEAEEGQTVMQARARERPRDPVLLLAPAALGAGQLPHLHGRDRRRRHRQAGSTSPATCRSPRACRC